MDDVRKLVTVKPLEWGKWGEARGGGAKYSVYEFGSQGRWNCVCYPHEGEQYKLAQAVFRDQAEAAAQADYEARIYAALTPSPSAHVALLREAERTAWERGRDAAADQLERLYEVALRFSDANLAHQGLSYRAAAYSHALSLIRTLTPEARHD